MRGLNLELASQPISETPGQRDNPPHELSDETGDDQAAGLGPWLEDDELSLFQTLHSMVLRQELLAKNRKAVDDYWTHVKQGHGDLYTLEKVPDRAVWKCQVAPGVNALRLQPVPNKGADLCNKVVETLMVDFPKPQPKAEDDSEEAEQGARLAGKFLELDGSEAGTRDERVFWLVLDGATSRSAQFAHTWVDKTGGGSIPLQIEAHPKAQDPKNPLVAMGPDGQPLPTTDPILRYVTLGSDGEPEAFVEDASQASPQWVPCLHVDVRGREHVRTYPETADVSDCEKLILLDYCTVSDAKRRWPETVGAMSDTEIATLCDWIPPRHMALLPQALRARWRANEGMADRKGSANDERILFFYVGYARLRPEHPRGAQVVISGARQGTLFERKPLSSVVPLAKGGSELRARDIPVTQWDLVLDADDGDPMALPLIARFGGAGMAMTTLMLGLIEGLDQRLHPATYTPVTSPVTGDDVSHSRATGDHIQVLSKDDYPHYEDPRDIPEQTFAAVNWLDQQSHDISGDSKAAVGSDSQEVSGTARQIAVNRSNIALSRFQQRFGSAASRYYRIKLQAVVAEFDVAQQIRYEGEDGAYTAEWWTGADFATVTDVGIKGGTNTMKPPEEKVPYLAQLVSQGFMALDDAKDAAKSVIASTLGVAEDTAVQRVERQVASWLKGPPSPEWIGQFQQYQQAKAQADQQTALAQQAYQQQAQVAQQSGQPVPPQPQPIQPQIPAPWSPFAPLPCDDEPMTAGVRQRRVKRLMETVRFTAQPPEWQQLVFDEYARMRNAVAAAQPAPPMPKGVNVAVKAGAADVAQAEQAATHPQSAPPANPAPSSPQALHITVGHPPRGPRTVQLQNHLGEVSHAVIHDHPAEQVA